MALGMNPEHYYKDGCNLSMPRQVMLDNVVWLCCFAKEKGIRIKRSLYSSLKSMAQNFYKRGYETVRMAYEYITKNGEVEYGKFEDSSAVLISKDNAADFEKILWENVRTKGKEW